MQRKNSNHKSESELIEPTGAEAVEIQGGSIVPPFLGSEPEGELAIDVFQTATQIVIQSPVAGVKEEDLDVSVEGDMVTIRGKRERESVVDDKDYFCQECYLGVFSRTVSLPTADLDIEQAEASLNNGILTIRIPRVEKKRSKKLKIGKE